MNFLDLLDMFNFIDRAEWLVMALRYRDLGRTVRIEHAQHDKSGKAAAAQTGEGYEALLKRYGVVIFGRRVTSKHLIFSVKTKQARWAEHILMRAGAHIVSRQIDKSNTGAHERHGGTLPVPWSEAKKGKRQ